MSRCAIQPPAVPILPPKYTTPGPTRSAGGKGPAADAAASVPTAEAVLQAFSGDEAANTAAAMELLDARLRQFSYVSGYMPGKADVE